MRIGKTIAPARSRAGKVRRRGGLCLGLGGAALALALLSGCGGGGDEGGGAQTREQAAALGSPTLVFNQRTTTWDNAVWK